jgi:hypothetical protein
MIQISIKEKRDMYYLWCSILICDILFSSEKG